MVPPSPPQPPPQSSQTKRRLRRGSFNDTLIPSEKLGFAERAATQETNSPWHLAQISVPKDVAFPVDGPYTYNFDDSLGEGQTIFIMDDGFVDIPSVRVLLLYA